MLEAMQAHHSRNSYPNDPCPRIQLLQKVLDLIFESQTRGMARPERRF